MPNNLFELIKSFNQFKKMLSDSNINPQDLLQQEIKKRNITPQQMQQMMQSVEVLKILLNGRF